MKANLVNMDLTLLLNFVLNQLFNNEGNNNPNNNNPNNNSSNTLNNPVHSGQVVHTPPQTVIRPFPDIHKYIGVFAILQEFGELLRRLIDKNYADSRIYKNSGRHEGKVAVMTDITNGIGAETATYLSKIGYKVIVGLKEEAERNPRVTRSIKNLTEGSNNVKILKLDLTIFDSIREFAKEVTKLEPKIDLLINSADQIVEQVLTKDGIENNFQRNYLGHFLLTNLLIPNLKKSENGRIVNISSITHYFVSIEEGEIRKLIYNIPVRAYAQSKLANVLFTRELSRRLSRTKITTYVVSPEMIKKPREVQNTHILSEMLSRISDPVVGSQTILYVSLEESLKNESGFYYNNQKKVHPLAQNGSDDNEAKKLWALSEKIVKIYDNKQGKDKVAGQSSKNA